MTKPKILTDKDVEETQRKLEKELGISHEEFSEPDFIDHGTFTEFMACLHRKGKPTKEELEWSIYIARKRDAQLIAKGLEPKWIKNWDLEKYIKETKRKHK